MYGLKNIDIRIKDQQLDFIMVKIEFNLNAKEIIHFLNLISKNHKFILSSSNSI